MKLLHILLLTASCVAPAIVSAQWQWIDKDGRKVYSDRAPPADIPEKSILKQPSGAVRPPASPAATQPASAASAASAPQASGKDAALEAKKKQAEDEEDAKRKSAADKAAKDKALNCERARATLTVLKSGVRMKLPNAKGEMEFVSDADRAAEIERVQGFVTNECKQ